MKALASGRDGLDLVDDVGAAHHLAKHGVTPALCAGSSVVQEAVVGDVDEELGRGECGSPVRAMATV
jgi:hypothetical protein